ncbi:MAG: asparagine synthase (glutamine-hydrolyzing) [Candidatus Brocadia sp.]|jgi:asparagine synthase (glutamine-hydrolysing)
MCGIAGILRFDGSPVQADELLIISHKLEHRGRDNAGLIIGSANNKGDTLLSRHAEIGFVHRRLSIIDLSDAAAQPMSYACGRLWITFNGEIYNYIELRHELAGFGYEFRTKSDTEVILAAYQQWGESCVEHFNGMFAFALWDESRSRLFCARDPIGIKPFYYILAPDFFAFASESSALSHVTDKTLNPDAVAAYLLCTYVPGPWSIFKGISKLQPGCTLIVTSNGRTSINRYWQIDKFEDADDDANRRLKMEKLLSDAVHRQLRSDVPVGALLSGGVDSSIVVALASEGTQKLHTFSVGYEGHYINELPHAREVAKRYKTCHHELQITAQQVIRNLNKALVALNEPIADTAIVPAFMLCELAAAEGVKVLLNGTGGDEVFGGYTRYITENMKKYLLEALYRGFQTRMSHLFPVKYSTLAMRFRHLGLDLIARAGGRMALSRSMFGYNKEFALFVERLARDCFPPVIKGIPMVYNRMLFDLNVYLVDELLVLLDQMTMAWTLEGRVPLLDIDVVRESFRFPARSHVMAGNTKMLLREIATHYLGSEPAFRKKQGFGGPVTFWVEQNLPEIREILSHLRHISCFEVFNMDRYFPHGHVRKLRNTEAFEIFILYCFAFWYNHKGKL